MEATFKGNSGYYSLLQLKKLLYVLSILGPEIWKSHLKENHDTTGYKSLIVTFPTEQTTLKTEAINWRLIYKCTAHNLKKTLFLSKKSNIFEEEKNVGKKN